MEHRKSLAALREGKGLNQQEVADILGITVAAYSRKENGKRPLYAHELKQLADFFGVKLDDIDFFAGKLTDTVSTEHQETSAP